MWLESPHYEVSRFFISSQMLDYYQNLKDSAIKKIPRPINIDAKIIIISSFRNNISSPIKINIAPNLIRALELWFLTS